MDRLQVYKCEECGNVVELLDVGGGDLVCCGDAMVLCDEQTADWKTEKHVPVVEAADGGVTVTVGSTLHPMEEDHYIQWIEIIEGDKVRKQFLAPGMDPRAAFCCTTDQIVAREFCNKHGLWKN